MTTQRWIYQILEIRARLFGNNTELVQAELSRVGAQGWELVSVTQPNHAVPIRLYLKKAA